MTETVAHAGRRVLVTGAAGFVGFHTAARLCEAGSVVLGFDNLNDYYDPTLKEARLAELATHPGFAFRRADVADPEAVARAFAEFRPAVVVHLAAQAGVRYSIDRPWAYMSANMDGFLSVLEACRHHPVAHLVFASSSSVYGGNVVVPFREQDGADHPVSLYAATKRANELMAHTYAHLYGVPVTGLRFFTVYGPWGRPDMAYWKFTAAILRGEPIDVYAEGRLSRDFTYVDDVVDGIVRLLDRPPVGLAASEQAASDPSRSTAPFRILNIGNHTPVGLGDFVAEIERATGRTAVKRHLPMQPGDVVATCADVSRLAAETGFAPRTPLRDGLARFVTWYRAYHGL